MASITLWPDAAGTLTGIDDCTEANHWSAVDDLIDSSYVRQDSGTDSDYYHMQALGIPGASIINSVRVRWRAYSHKIFPGGFGDAAGGLRLGGVNVTVSFGLDNAWLNYDALISRPGGGSWTVADFAATEFVLTLASGSGWSACSSIRVDIDYTPSLSVNPILFIG